MKTYNRLALVAAVSGILTLLAVCHGWADALDDYQRDRAASQAQLDRQREAYEQRVEQGQAQYDRMQAEQWAEESARRDREILNHLQNDDDQ